MATYAFFHAHPDDEAIATGGTMEACCELVNKLGGQIVGVTVLIELSFLKGRDKLSRFGQAHAVLTY